MPPWLIGGLPMSWVYVLTQHATLADWRSSHVMGLGVNGVAAILANWTSSQVMGLYGDR